MPIDALPPKLQATPLPAGDGTDLDNRAQKYWNRGWTSFGPRVENQRWTVARQGIPFTRWSIPIPIPLLARWRMFPVVLVGYNIARWMGPEDISIIFVGRFVKKLIWFGTDFYQVPSIEMQPNNRKFNESITSMIRGRWWWADGEKWITQYAYGPSPIQNLAYGVSWAVTWPGFFQWTYRRKREGRADFVINFHVGCRWDSGESYFSFPAFFLGLAFN